jgi:hypothetical protein
MRTPSLGNLGSIWVHVWRDAVKHREPTRYAMTRRPLTSKGNLTHLGLVRDRLRQAITFLGD